VPHSFRNPGEGTARLLCTVSPSGLEKFFAEFGDPVPTRTSPAPPLSDAEREERLRRAIERAPAYGMEILPPAARASNEKHTDQQHQQEEASDEGHAVPRLRRSQRPAPRGR
jgi:hypothetical protein